MEGRGREGLVLPEQQSKAEQHARQRRGTGSNGEKTREASLVLELHRASTCYPRAEQEIERQAMDEAGQREKRRKKR